MSSPRASEPDGTHAAPVSELVLALRGVSVTRPGGWSVAADDLVLRAGEVGALVGPSGCGKTTFLLGWTGLLPGLEVRGDRRVLSQAWPNPDTSAGRQMLAGPVTVVLQDAKAALDPLQRIAAQMQTATGKPLEDSLAALHSLGVVAAARIAGAWPHQLSGGEAQRVLLAIALLRAPRLLIVDEPTASLDGASIEDLVSGLHLLQERHRTAILLATHDMSLVAATAARVWEFAEGRFRIATGTADRWSAVPRGDELESDSIVLEARGVTKAFGDNTVLRELDLTLARGEVVAVVGPSGCGKTTLGRILAGHLAADRGVIVGGDGVQLLFQDAFASLTPHRTVRSLIDETRVVAFDSVREAQAIGLPDDQLDRRSVELSGGERRRAALLRALSVAPPVLILDEPTASLDHETARSVMGMVISVQRRRGLACLLITHDQAMAEALAHRVLCLRDGRLA